MPELQFFEEEDRVVSRRKIKPFRDNGTMIPVNTPGTIETLTLNMAYVQFDGYDFPVNVPLSDLDLLSADEQFVISVGFWPASGGTDATY